MRILLVVTQMEQGGAQSAALRLAAGLRQRGHLAEVCFLYRKRPVHDHQPHVHTVFPRRPAGPLEVAVLLRGLYGHIRGLRPDVVISFTHYANVICQPIAMLAGVRGRIASQRNAVDSYPRLARLLDRLLGTTSLYGVNVAVSRSVQDSFAGYPVRYLRKLRVVENGVPESTDTAEWDAVRTRLGLADGVPFLLAVGRLAEQKNHQLLIRCLPSLEDVCLVVAGEGPLRQELSRLAESLGVSERLRMPGELPEEEVRVLMREATLFLMPSLFEGQSNALLEALQCGMAIVASRVRAVSDVLLSGDGPPAGYLVSPCGEQAWVDAIRRLCADSQHRDRLACRALQVSARFTLDAMVEGFERAIHDAVDGRCPQREVN